MYPIKFIIVTSLLDFQAPPSQIPSALHQEESRRKSILDPRQGLSIFVFFTSLLITNYPC